LLDTVTFYPAYAVADLSCERFFSTSPNL